MKGLKIGYGMVMSTLLAMMIAVGIAAFYPAPKLTERPKYPSLGGGYGYDTTSPDYQQYQSEQKKYQEELNEYDKKNETVQKDRKVWGQNVYSITLVFSVLFLLAGLLAVRASYMVGVSFMFGSFLVLVLGAALATYHAEGSISSIFGRDSATDLSTYKLIQFAVLFVGCAVGTAFGFMGPFKEKREEVVATQPLGGGTV